jgi:hypothetical protein
MLANPDSPLRESQTNLIVPLVELTALMARLDVDKCSRHHKTVALITGRAHELMNKLNSGEGTGQ